MHSVIIIHF